MTFKDFWVMDIGKFFKSKFSLEISSSPTQDLDSIEILELICGEFLDKLKIEDLPQFMVWSSLDHVNFCATRQQAIELEHVFPTMRIERPHFGRNNEHMYRISLSDYRRYQARDKNKMPWLLENRIEPAIGIMQENREAYNYILNTYEIGLYTLYSTIKENKEYNGGKLNSEIEEEAYNILAKFYDSFSEKRKEILKIEAAMHQATNENHLHRLRIESEHIDRFIKGGKVDE